MKPEPDPPAARDFAIDVVRRLREAGFQALWAGGCVRDHLLELQPKDYDVATNATPEQIREVFGRRRTLAIGQAFGVIVVLGPRSAGQIDVATFRRDAAYSDGRHPDHVTFSTAAEDAQRRDFTINGLFFDPVAGDVIDYVGGQEDLERKLIRAIGDPFERFAEDKLRMLRAVRIAATFEFEIEAGTLAAIQQEADQLVVVSAERIAAELRRMLQHEQRRRAVELLIEARLMPVILPEMGTLLPDSPQSVAPTSVSKNRQGDLRSAVSAGSETPADRSDSPPSAPPTSWQQTLEILQRLQQPSFAVAFAALVRTLTIGHENGLQVIQQIGDRLRLSNDEKSEIGFVLKHESDVRRARRLPWPRLQRILIRPLSPALLTYSQAVAEVLDGTIDDIQYCRQQLDRPPEELNPPPLITGDDLRQCGLPRGPVYRQILEGVREAQLEGHVRNEGDALSLARALFEKLSNR